MPLIPNGTFDTDTSGWTASGSSLSAVGGHLRVTNTGAAAGYGYLAADVVVGQLYHVGWDDFAGSTNPTFRVGNTVGGVDYVNAPFSGSGQSWSFTPTQTPIYLSCAVGSSTNGDYAEFDNIILGAVYPGQIDETLKVSQTMAGVRAQLAQVNETVTLTDALAALYGIELVERIAIDQGETVNAKFNMTVAEQASFRADLMSAWPVEIAEVLQITAAQVVQTAVTVMESLQLEDVLTPALMYHMTLSERLVVSDALAKFLGADITESLTITPAMSAEAFKTARVDETLSVADALTPQLLLRLTVNENIDFTADEAVRMVFNAEIDETIEIAGAYVAPNGSVTTWVMNTRSGGVTEYQNYAFNSFARIGNKYLGAADDGLYELLGDKDDGEDIVATIRSGFAQWAGTHLGSFKAAYLAVRGVGQYVLRVLTADGKTYNYTVTAADGRTVKVNMGKGLRSRYFAFELVSTGQDFDLDTLEFIPLVAERRV